VTKRKHYASRRKPKAANRKLQTESRNRERRPRLVFGPGLLIALLIAAFLVHREGLLRPHPGPVVVRDVAGTDRVGVRNPKMENGKWKMENGKSDINHQPSTINHHLLQFPTPTPEVGWLLERRAALGLSDSQVHQLEQLQQEWEQATAEDRAMVEQAAAEFRGYLNQAQEQGHVRPQDLSQQGELVRELSGRLAAARQDFWERAMKILTATQRARVDQARRAE
jgi:hypothetical protein